MVGNLALIPSKTRFDVHLISETEIGSNSRLNKLAPPLLPISTLHPVLVELTQFLVWFRRKFGELFHGMLENLIVNPDTGAGR